MSDGPASASPAEVPASGRKGPPRGGPSGRAHLGTGDNGGVCPRVALSESGPLRAVHLSRHKWPYASLRVVHSGLSTCHVISGRGDAPVSGLGFRDVGALDVICSEATFSSFKAQGPSRTCNESKEEEEEATFSSPGRRVERGGSRVNFAISQREISLLTTYWSESLISS